MTALAVVNDDDESQPLLATIRAVKAGDHDAFEDLMIATERRVASLAWRILGDAEDVKDAVQETFVRVFRHLEQYHEDRSFFAWLFRIAVNVCRDHERRRRWRNLLSPLQEYPIAARFDQTLEARDAVTRAINQLPRRERLAVILRDIQELSTEEVAAILGLKPSSLKVSISKARARLRVLLEEER